MTATEPKKDITKFLAGILPDFDKTALDLIKTYENTPGSTGPGCFPEAVAKAGIE